MTQSLPPQGLEPLDEVTVPGLPPKPRSLHSSVRLTVHGRSVTLRRLRRPPKGIWRWLLILGPGVIATSAGNDAGGIATYSAAGARYGYDLISVMIVLTLSFAVVQEMSSRLGAATGRGLLDLIRERFGIGPALLAIVTILLANGGLVVTEFVGIGAAAELLGVSKYVAVPLAALLVGYLVLYETYAAVERVFLAMTLVFFAYPIAAFMAHPDWGAVARGAFVPTLRAEPGYLLVVVGLLGTTITPYMQVFQQSSIVERRVARRHYGPERWDAYLGAVFSDLMSVAMIIATAATLHAAGRTELGTAADAARALEPVVGAAAKTLFAFGLLGASLLAGSVLPLATAYAVTEVLGVPRGINLDYRRARLFFGLFGAMLVVGAGVALIPAIPVIQVLLLMQVLNGVLLPVILFFMLRLINDERLMGSLKNGRLYNWLAWGTFGLVTACVLVMLALQARPLLGL